MPFSNGKTCYHIKTFQRLHQGGSLYIYTLFTAISSFEVERNLWRPYLSLCLQKLSPLSGRLNFEPQNLVKA